ADGDAAKDVARRRRPTVSVWAVNQLHWHAREALDQLLAAAGRVRSGDLEATGEHRDALARLRQRAVALLKAARLGTSEAVLRRVMATLAAIAAAGGFEPDAPGMLTSDRDPPGFDALDAQAGARAVQHHRKAPARERPARDDAAVARAREHDEREAARAEATRRAAERIRRVRERREVETRLRAARAKALERERAV